MSSTPTIKPMPSQKKSDYEKIKNDYAWAKECIDAGEGMVLLNNDYTRSSRYRKLVNYDLVNGKLHQSDVQRIVNPYKLKKGEFPAEIQNHPITDPYIKALAGEEIQRRFDWNLKVVNEDAVSLKEQEKKDLVFQELQAILVEGLEQPQADPNTAEGQAAYQNYEAELSKRLAQLNKKVNYEYQDLRELSGTHLLNSYDKRLGIKSIRTRGWFDAMIVGEEIYCVDVIANEPTVKKCNPNNTHFLLSPDSYQVEDAELIVEEDYVPLARIIDDYYEYLTPAQIQTLEEKTAFKGSANYGGFPGYELQDPVFSVSMTFGGIDIGELPMGYTNGFMPYDNQNNVRRVKVVWSSLREIGVVTYPDENGEEQKKYVEPDYKPNFAQGEKMEKIWIREWWEGTKIANEIYLKMQPRPIQFRQLNNLSKCASGYVGTLYKINSSQVQSLFDIMKPYQYKYNIYYHRLEKLMMNNIGKIMTLDLSKVPDNWEVDKWLYYAREMNIAVVDSFKEAKKGAATGRLAGNMSNNSPVIDQSLGNEIQSVITALEYIKNELDLVSGISPQRRGQIKSSEQGLGVTEQAVQASATITEWYFKLHDETGLRLMSTLLETAKYCLRNGNKMVQYTADDMTNVIYNIDSDLLNESEYDLTMNDGTADLRSRQMLERASEIALQTGQVDLIQMMDIGSNESMASIRRKIERSIQENKENENQKFQTEQQQIAQERQLQRELRQQELELQKYKIDMDNQTKIRVAEINALRSIEGPVDMDQDGIADPIEVAEQSLKERELLSKNFETQRKQELDNKKIETDKYLKERELKLKDEELKSKERIERLKAQTAIRVAKQNKNKFDKKK